MEKTQRYSKTKNKKQPPELHIIHINYMLNERKGKTVEGYRKKRALQLQFFHSFHHVNIVPYNLTHKSSKNNW